MGWITRRNMRQGRTKWGKPISEEKRKAPLRKITRVIRYRVNMFDSDYVELECGHKAWAYGDFRARCTECSKTR